MNTRAPGMHQQSSNLDLLRAIAVMLVFVSHVLKVRGVLENPLMVKWGISDIGHLGVLMFFIHTSLVLMFSLDRLSRCGGRLALRFYVRRLFRLYPLSILTVCAVVLLRVPDYFEPTYQWLGMKTFVANLLLVQNVAGLPSVTGPLWSLPFEMQMYLLLPLLYLVARRIRSYVGVACQLASGFVLWWVEEHVARALHYPALFEYAPWFFMGISCYAMSRLVSRSLSAKLYLPSIAGLIVVFLGAHGLVGGYRQGWVVWGGGILFALALPLFQDVTAKPVRLVSGKIATYSYGIYLCHVPILWFAFMRLAAWPWWAQTAIALALMVAVPVLLYHTVEAPMIAVGARIAHSMESQDLAQAGRAA